MTNSLVDLPQELLLKIIDHVQDSNSLFNLLQCCHLTYDLALPQLYCDVEIWQPRHVNPFFRFNRLYSFTCQILRSHERASLVKRFTFREVYAYVSSELGNGTTGQVSHEQVDENLQKVVCRARFSKTDEKGWLRDLQSNNPTDALLAILLPSLPCLEHLNMAFPYTQRYYSRMLMSIVTRPGRVFPESAFERLKHVVIPFSDRVGDHRATGIWPHQLNYLLRVPSLQSVSAHVYDENDHDVVFEDDEKAAGASWDGEKLLSSNVSSLALESFILHSSMVELKVRMCSNLKSLKLHWVYTRGTDPVMANGQISSIPHAITSASQKLESLSLTYTSWGAARESLADSQMDSRCRISLTDYPNLRSLTLGMAWIFGLQLFHCTSNLENVSSGLLAQLLPSAIETLRIERGDIENVAPILPNIEAILLERQSGRFESLKSITLLDKRSGMTLRGKLQGKYPSIDLLGEVSDFATRLGVTFRRVILPDQDNDDDEEKKALEELKQAEPFESYIANNGWPG